MVATVALIVLYGAGPAESADISGASFRLINAASVDGDDDADITNPIPIPTAGLSYSFYKHMCLDITGGTFTQIDNVQLWCDGAIGWAMGTSGLLQVGTRDAGDHGCPTVSYDQAQGDGTDGYPIDDNPNGHPYYYGQTTGVQNIENFTSGAKMTVDSGAHTVAENCKGTVFQVVVDTDATQGVQADETITISYDEI